MALIPFDGRNGLLDLVGDHWGREDPQDCLCSAVVADDEWQSGAAMQAHPLPSSQPYTGRGR